MAERRCPGGRSAETHRSISTGYSRRVGRCSTGETSISSPSTCPPKRCASADVAPRTTRSVASSTQRKHRSIPRPRRDPPRPVSSPRGSRHGTRRHGDDARAPGPASGGFRCRHPPTIRGYPAGDSTALVEREIVSEIPDVREMALGPGSPRTSSFTETGARCSRRSSGCTRPATGAVRQTRGSASARELASRCPRRRVRPLRSQSAWGRRADVGARRGETNAGENRSPTPPSGPASAQLIAFPTSSGGCV